MERVTCLESRLLAGLIVGGADVKYHVAGRVKAEDFLDTIHGAVYRLVMEIPPIQGENERKRLWQEIAQYLGRHCESPAEADAWTRKVLLSLILSCDTVDGGELASMADTLHGWANQRRWGIGEGVHMLLSEGEKSYREIRRALESDGWPRVTIDAALRLERNRGRVRSKIVSKQSVWGKG